MYQSPARGQPFLLNPVRITIQIQTWVLSYCKSSVLNVRFKLRWVYFPTNTVINPISSSRAPCAPHLYRLPYAFWPNSISTLLLHINENNSDNRKGQRTFEACVIYYLRPRFTRMIFHLSIFSTAEDPSVYFFSWIIFF